MKLFLNASRIAFNPRRAGCAMLLCVGMWLAGSLCARAIDLPIHYTVDLHDPSSHMVRVAMTVPDAGAGIQFQIPTWNNLYQIRDFVRDIQQVEAQCDGQPAPLKRLDLNTWQSLTACRNLQLQYAVYANQDDIFSAALNKHHAFLNCALLLFYLPQDRERAVCVKFLLPPDWKLATLLDDGPAPGEYQAANYDRLVDSPAEAGKFQEYDYVQDGATFRVVVDAEPKAYSPKKLLDALKKITAAETGLMRDVPFSRYTFIYHFPESGQDGGMEHMNGAAITLSADRLRDSLFNLESMSAHEFFHLWNVKRIRPKGLEPIDYIHGNDTSDLWFSEGVTSTYAELVLLRAGIINRKEFYAHLASQIGVLEERPARLFQSVAESGREAWLEKYPDYFRAERSISYYNKGELLGDLLDLAIRHTSENSHSLDDLMRTLNRDFAKTHRAFDDADLERIIRQLTPAFTGCGSFFRDDVDGSSELDYETYLGYAGLQLATETVQLPDLGLKSLKSFIGPVRVESVEPGSGAAEAGLKPGDVLLKINGREIAVPPEQEIYTMKPGEHVRLTVQRGSNTFEVEFALGAREGTVFKVGEAQHPTQKQLAIRNGWLKGRTRPSQAAEN